MSVFQRRWRASHASKALLLCALVSVSCLSRPATSFEPTLKTSFESKVRRQAIDKIDLVLAIDNSASMGDKQKFLAKAVPLLVDRLVKPTCVPKGQGVLDRTKACPDGQDVLFAPIEDIHVAVVTSSLGTPGSICDPNGRDAAGRTYNDQGLPIARASGPNLEPTVVESEAGHFLAWLPDSAKNAEKPPAAHPYKEADKLSDAISSVVRGAGENGCGFESQLESVYRFLIAPDPWERVVVDNYRAHYEGVDNNLLAVRKAFLRPDSLVAVVMLTDEDDSSIDLVGLGGSGWAYGAQDFPAPDALQSLAGRQRPDGGGTTAARGTSICATNPGSPDCTSCAYQYSCGNLSQAQCDKIKNDANCKENGGYHTPETDPTNVRFHHMKQRFGVDPLYPTSRYARGLSSPVVPNRWGEHDGSSNYVGSTDGMFGCTNPLFAKTLPSQAPSFASQEALADGYAHGKFDWCKLPRGDRDPGLVYFAVVGGVPNELVHFDPAKREPNELTEDDWVKILGQSPAAYDERGMDPRMQQSSSPRDGRRSSAPDSPSSDPGNTDHRDWKTGGTDLEYACTFPLPLDMQRTRTNDNARSFDCLANSDAPLCEGPIGTIRKQIRGKAYPTRRELEVAHQLGSQGIVASLCPQVTDGDVAAPLYGYNPAIATIISRIAVDLTAQCLPDPLTLDSEGLVSCLLIEELEPSDKRGCASIPGRTALAPELAASYREANPGTPEQAKGTLCKLDQLKSVPGENCRFGKAGWCYARKTASAKPAGSCSQAIVLSDAALESGKGSTLHLQCIEQSGTGAAGKGR